jgi:hypothetical protein
MSDVFKTTVSKIRRCDPEKLPNCCLTKIKTESSIKWRATSGGRVVMTTDLMQLWHLERELGKEEAILLSLTVGEKEFYRAKEKIDTIVDRIVALRASVSGQH